MAARNGKTYTSKGLRDGREVWLHGRKVRDVTEEELLRPVIDATAKLYDLQYDPKFRVRPDIPKAPSSANDSWLNLSGAARRGRSRPAPQGHNALDGAVMRLSRPRARFPQHHDHGDEAQEQLLRPAIARPAGGDGRILQARRQQGTCS